MSESERPRRRLLACVKEWPDCETGLYDPRCCRFPKSCSCTVYDERYVTDADLEPAPRDGTITTVEEMADGEKSVWLRRHSDGTDRG